MLYIPTPLDVPQSQQAGGKLRVRYDDIAQNGKVRLTAIPPLMGEIVWGLFLSEQKHIEMYRQGIVPILTRLVLTNAPGPFSATRDLEGSGGYQFAHSVGAQGEVDRLYVNMWTLASGPHAETYAPPPAPDSPRVQAGSIHAEHVLTRPFAEAGSRKVTALSLDGLPTIPEKRISSATYDGLLSLPEGAKELGSAHDEVVTFGLMHTDSNRHVNSLVYPTLFEQTALALFSRLGIRETLLASWADIRFRKPCFAGQNVRFSVRAFEMGGKKGVAGQVVEIDTHSPPNCTALMIFE